MKRVAFVMGVAAVCCFGVAVRVAIELHNGIFFALATGMTIVAIRKTISVYRSF